MHLKQIIEEKRAWRAHMARVKALPEDYQLVYREIQKYIFKAGPVEPNASIDLLAEIAQLFWEGAAAGRTVLEVTGDDVAAFCDALID